MKYFNFLIFFLVLGLCKTNAQEVENTKVVKDTTLVISKDAKSNKKKDKEFSIEDYKIISYQRDTTTFDTTLTIYKEYKYNYLRKDDFELLPFANVGQTYNILGAETTQKGFYPRMGEEAKYNNYMEVEDISYYRVPTPTTELFYKTVMEQGQILDAMITLNTSPRLNMSIAYKGMRSLGKYQHILSSTGNFRFTTNYQTKNGKYQLRAHYASQDILNEENGGLAVPEQFTSGDDEFIDRSRIDVKFDDAENFLLGKRYFLDHQYYLFKEQDSLKNYGLAIGHQLNYETKTYEFRQDAANAYFGEAYQAADLNDRAKFKSFNNQLNLNYRSKIVGDVTFLVNFYKYNYYFNSVVVTPNQTITNQLRDNEISVGGKWKKQIGGFFLNADFTQNIVGDMGGTVLNAQMGYQLTNDISVDASLHASSRMPNYNFLLYQSDYKNYNWQYTDTFEKQKISTLQGTATHKKWGSLSVAYTIRDKYAYFEEQLMEGDSVSVEDDVQLVSPIQFGGSINSMKVKFSNDLHFLRRWGLANTIMYQNVSQSENILNVPDIVTRNTLYYSNHLFKKALYLQVGVTAKYFTEYYMNSYSPVLGELLIQDREEIGGFPLFDLFINAKVRRTRIYLKAEHFNTIFTSEYNYYSAPNNPYRDFIVRFGVVWNFFS
ncbi:putative porin [Galbibacter pacificus]|uniref:Porin n=1 Tax=Galbibacter pacificus TaxID=2996052 RepID=A0ABT6FMX9_9FLAO|nr:putative porin [Galbibacter pacificus]MDG3580973.1 putative porin [Galbibacter pacificus]MDG3584451.1 putative porin [Galbibacter pacificus]